MPHLKLLFAVLLLLCLTPMPYGFYQLVRFVAMIYFAMMAYEYLEKERGELAITFSALALLFQPFFKIALGRTIWNVVDVIVAIGCWHYGSESEKSGGMINMVSKK